MSMFKRLADWLGISPPKLKPEFLAVREVIDMGRQSLYAENFQDALDYFQKAEQMASKDRDLSVLAIINLNIADSYLNMDDLPQAESILNKLKASSEELNHKTPLSYVTCALGYLQQLQGNWEKARELYYSAIKIADDNANAVGARGRAKGRLADIYLREGNATYAEHLLREALSLLDQSGDLELSSYFIGRYAQALIVLGRENDGDRLLLTALQRAERVNYRQYIRMWHRVLAERRMEQKQYQKAKDHYIAYLQHTRKPSTQESGIVLGNLSKIERQLGNQQEALDYALRAEEVLSRYDTAELSSEASTAIGLALRANKQSADAIAYFERALQSTDQSDLIENIHIRIEIAQTYFLMSDYSQAQASYEALRDFKQIDQYPAEYANILSGLGMTYHKQGKTDDALSNWMNAVKLYEQLYDYNRTARLYCDIAQLLYSQGQAKRALGDYERAMMLLNSIDKETRGIVMANAAIAYADKGDIATTESFFIESIEIARELGNTSAEATRRNNYAFYLIDTGNPQRAIISLERALELSQQNDDQLSIAIHDDNLGIAYLALDKYEKALKFHHRAREILSGTNWKHWQAMNAIHLADTYLDLNQTTDAQAQIEAAITYADGLDDYNLNIELHIAHARLALKLENLTEATNAILLAIEKSRYAYRQRLLAKALILHSKIQAHSDKELALATWQEAEQLLIQLQIPRPNPNWLHVPSA